MPAAIETVPGSSGFESARLPFVGAEEPVISAGDGAAAALNVLSKEEGENFHDFDTPADADRLFGPDEG